MARHVEMLSLDEALLLLWSDQRSITLIAHMTGLQGTMVSARLSSGGLACPQVPTMIIFTTNTANENSDEITISA